MGSNASADVIDFEVLDFSKTQKSKYLENKLIFFSSNKKKNMHNALRAMIWQKIIFRWN